MILGAGRGNFDAQGKFLAVRTLSETGGVEATELGPQQVPQEVTQMNGVSVSGDGFLRLLKEETLRSTSISQWALRVPTPDRVPSDGEIEVEPHNNMPPFIVLHICKRQ